MQIKVDGVVVLELTPLCRKIIQYDTSSDIFDEDMIRRVKYAWEHKVAQSRKRLIDEWLPILQQDSMQIPTDRDALCEFIFADPRYKCKKTREKIRLAERAAELKAQEDAAKVVELAAVQVAIKKNEEDREREEEAENKRQAEEADRIKTAVDAAVMAALHNINQQKEKG